MSPPKPDRYPAFGAQFIESLRGFRLAGSHQPATSAGSPSRLRQPTPDALARRLTTNREQAWLQDACAVDVRKISSCRRAAVAQAQHTARATSSGCSTEASVLIHSRNIVLADSDVVASRGACQPRPARWSTRGYCAGRDRRPARPTCRAPRISMRNTPNEMERPAAGDRADVENAAAPPLDHAGQHALNRVHRPGRRSRPAWSAVRRPIVRAARRAASFRAVHEAVDTAELRRRAPRPAPHASAVTSAATHGV